MQKRQVRLISQLTTTTTILGSVIWASAAYSATFFKPHLPDFYQHQKAGPDVQTEDESKVVPGFPSAAPKPGNVPSYDLIPNWWEKNGGWCCVTAFVNSFYFLEKNYGYHGLFTRTGGETKNWLEQMIYAIEDFAEDFFFGGLPALPPGEDPDDYDFRARHLRKIEEESKQKLENSGKKPKSPLSYSRFVESGGQVVRGTYDNKGKLALVKDVSSTFSSLFEAYHAELCRSEDVTVRFEGTSIEGDPWWEGSFHVVTGAGVADCKDNTNKMFWFADPDKRNVIVDGMYPNNDDVRQPYPNIVGGNPPIPIGEKHYEKVTVDANGVITDGIYKGAKIAEIVAISPTHVPEPSSILGLFALGGLGLTQLRKKRQ
ncbi:MAG: PEP-CTERM sorting domain-containing protein [Crocosphaera sp.]|nr:PEP-CTERM sorting domain-containing protein [Crocosphaera sp.]